MRSMTGYGHGVWRSEDYIVECDIKSYNNRYLDIVKNMTAQLSSYESYVDSEVGKVARRGHVEVSLRLKALSSDVSLIIDRGLLDAYSSAFREIEAVSGCSGRLSDLLAVDGILTADRNSSADRYREGVESALGDALRMISSEKDREGEGTKRDLEKLGNEFASSLAAIEKRSGDLEAHYRKLLEEKYLALTGEKAGSSDFMAELGAILVRYSINEEVSRLGVHIAEYRKLLESADPCGKRLDFLCQEMQRECNTIASKSQLADINLLVVRMKDNIENIREQIRNIE